MDWQHVNPSLLQKLNSIGRDMHSIVVIYSGYRSNAYSVQVGGFSGDPHTHGIAVDAKMNGREIGLVVSARVFAKYGLRSGNQANFYNGKPDPGHVDLGGSGGGTSPGQSRLEKLWIKAGGPPAMAGTMAAIAMAESGGRSGAKHVNSDGSVDRGIWQINSVHGYGDSSFNALQNAKQAVAIYNGSGLGAWTTYTSGAYRNFLGGSGGGGGRGSVETGVPAGTRGPSAPQGADVLPDFGGTSLGAVDTTGAISSDPGSVGAQGFTPRLTQQLWQTLANQPNASLDTQAYAQQTA